MCLWPHDTCINLHTQKHAHRFFHMYINSFILDIQSPHNLTNTILLTIRRCVQEINLQACENRHTHKCHESVKWLKVGGSVTVGNTNGSCVQKSWKIRNRLSAVSLLGCVAAAWAADIALRLMTSAGNSCSFWVLFKMQKFWIECYQSKLLGENSHTWVLFRWQKIEEKKPMMLLCVI